MFLVKMKFVLFTFVYILGPEISFARKYLIIDLDAVKQLELNSHWAHTDDTIKTQQPKDLIKTVLSTLQSFDEYQLKNILSSVKNKLPNLNINDATFHSAKRYLLNLLSEGKDKPYSQIKGIMSFVSQIVDDDNYADQINSAYSSAVNYFKNQMSHSYIDDATLNKAKEYQVSEKFSKEILDIMNVLSQSQDDEEKTSLRAIRGDQKVGRLFDHSKSRDETKFNILDQIQSTLQSWTKNFFKPMEPSRSNDFNLTPEEEKVLNKLGDKLQKEVNKFDWSAMWSKFVEDVKKLFEGRGV